MASDDSLSDLHNIRASLLATLGQGTPSAFHSGTTTLTSAQSTALLQQPVHQAHHVTSAASHSSSVSRSTSWLCSCNRKSSASSHTLETIPALLVPPQQTITAAKSRRTTPSFTVRRHSFRFPAKSAGRRARFSTARSSSGSTLPTSRLRAI